MSQLKETPSSPHCVSLTELFLVGFLHATWRAWNRGHFVAGGKTHQGRDSVRETEFVLVWATQLKSLNTNWEGGPRRILSPALLIPPGLDVPYFQVKCPLLPLSALWSSPAISLSIISFLRLLCSGGAEGKRRGDLIYIKSTLKENNSSSAMLLIRLGHQRGQRSTRAW